jgi:hypothetical protein
MLRLLVSALSADQPVVVVLDELPYLPANDPGFEGTLQKVFDRDLLRAYQPPGTATGITTDRAAISPG